MPEISVQALDVMATATWSFRDSVPTWRHSLFTSTATFDPFPAYPHPVEDVKRAAAHVGSCCPPSWNVDLFIADREEVGRSNGFSNITENSHYEGDEWVQEEPTGVIMLSGKRVPPHPAVTRYLVAHEYGHNVEWMLNKARGAKTTHDEKLVEEYAQLRGMTSTHHGSGGRWHDSAHEVLACDFRILVCEVEPDYWPHPGVPRPEAVDGLANWWTEAVDTLATNARAEQR
jgi:hypothetical protein